MWGYQGGRTSQAALPNATLSKQNQTSADAACDGMSWQGGGFSCARGGDGRESRARHTCTENDHIEFATGDGVSNISCLSHPMRVPGGDLGGARDGSGLGSAGSDGNWDLEK